MGMTNLVVSLRILKCAGGLRLVITHSTRREYYESNLYIADRGSTVDKVLCYKSVGRWFDRSSCQWIFH